MSQSICLVDGLSSRQCSLMLINTQGSVEGHTCGRGPTVSMSSHNRQVLVMTTNIPAVYSPREQAYAHSGQYSNKQWPLQFHQPALKYISVWITALILASHPTDPYFRDLIPSCNHHPTSITYYIHKDYNQVCYHSVGCHCDKQRLKSDKYFPYLVYSHPV